METKPTLQRSVPEPDVTREPAGDARAALELLRHLDGLERDLLRGHAAIIARRRRASVSANG